MKKIYIKYIIICLSIFIMNISTSSSIFNILLYSTIIIPLAVIVGKNTSFISEYIGEKKGGLLSAASGNIPELSMGIWSIKCGMISMAKSALIGAIISNILLVLGVSIFAGGVKYKEQKFNKIVARTNFSMLFIALSTMIIIASLSSFNKMGQHTIAVLSMKVAVVLIFVYVLGLVFSLYTHSNLFIVTTGENEENILKKDKNFYKLLFEIIICSLFIYFISESLILNIKQVVHAYNVSEEFLGIILIPLLGNMGENLSAIICAFQNKINLSLEIAIGSSIQISLFVTPILVIFSYFLNLNMTLLFSPFQIIIAIIAGIMSFFVFQDGKTYWFEGVVLISTYIIVTLAYYYIA